MANGQHKLEHKTIKYNIEGNKQRIVASIFEKSYDKHIILPKVTTV